MSGDGRHERQEQHRPIDLSSSDFGKECRQFRNKGTALIHDGIRFQSRSEVACAVLMEKYINSFRVREGVTYQVPIGFDRFVDFRVFDEDGRSVLIEYHPINLRFELSKPVYGRLSRLMHHIPKQERRELRDILRTEMLAHYSSKRRWVVQHSRDPEIQNCEVLICDSPERFYRAVIKRFGQSYPNEHQFLREFERIERDCDRKNRHGYDKLH